MNEYNKLIKEKENLRQQIFDLKLEFAHSKDENKRTLLKEKNDILKKQYAHNSICINKYKKKEELKNEEYKRR